MRNIRRPGAILGSLVVVVAATVLAVPARAADGSVPAGYRVVGREQLEPGVDHITLRRDQPPQNVHVARLAPGMSNRLRPVLSSDVMTGPAAGAETTSSMCARVRCVVAVNGDFAGPGGAVVGGMIARGELVATFGMPQWQVNFDAAGKATIHDDLGVGLQVTTADGQGTGVERVNRPLVGEHVNLYSRRWGPSTLTGADTVEVILGLASSAVLPSGVTAIRSVTLRSGGNSPIGPGQVVLAGRGVGAQALSAFAQRASRGGASLVVQLPAQQSIGAAPHLLSRGRLAFAPDEVGSFMQGRHPRTMVGFTATGETLLVTVDGRQGASTGLEHLIALFRELQVRGVDLVVLDQGIDTSTAVGRMFFQILGAMAEFEHALMSERTREGLAAGRARGRTGGQKPKLTPRQARIAQAMYDARGPDGKRAYTVQHIAEEFGVTRPTIYRHLERNASPAGAGQTVVTALSAAE